MNTIIQVPVLAARLACYQDVQAEHYTDCTVEQGESPEQCIRMLARR